MFKRFKTLLNLLETGKPGPEKPKPAAGKAAAPATAGRKETEKPKAGRDQAKAAATPSKPQSPEEICGVNGKMSKDEIKDRLALLYRRYNRATSSLDAGLRAEAEEVLDAIVAVREKVVGPI